MLMCRLTLTNKCTCSQSKQIARKTKISLIFFNFCVLGASYEKKQKKDTKFVAICESFEVLGAVLRIREQCVELV